MIKPAEEVTSQTSNENIKSQHKTKFPVTFSLILLSLTVGLILLILYYFNVQKTNIVTDIKKDLSVIADLKVKQIENWRNERLLDGQLISGNKIMVRNFLSLYKDKNNTSLKNDIQDLFESFCVRNKYLTARLVDVNGETIISYPESAIKVGKSGLMHIKKASELKKTFLSDVHKYENTDKIHMDLVIPVSDDINKDIEVFLLLEVDPNVYLYPTIQIWPAESKSAESLIVKKDNDEVVYLNDLKHLKNTALKHKINTSKTNVPSVQAVNGVTGITEGLDYRNVPVIAYIKPIAGTDWYMITKIDKDEIFEDINRSSFAVTVLIVFVILVSGFGIFLYWSKQREKYLKKILDSERQRIALVSHFDSVIKNANDVFILYDENAKVVEVNEKAISLYGYTKEEFLKLDLNDLRAPDVRSDVNDTIRYVKNHPDGLLFETRHIKKDRSIFPVESSTRFLQLGDKFFFQSVVRDITERKQAEKALLESEHRFSTAFRLSPEAIVIISVKTKKVLDVNETFIKRSGLPRNEVIGRFYEELDLFIDKEKRDEIFKKVLEKGNVIGEECDFKANSGETVNCIISIVGVQISGEPCFIMSIVDITERKKAEEKIEYLNRIYALLSQINQAIVRIDNKQELFEKICSIAIEFGKFSFAWIGILDEKNSKVLPVAHDGFENGYLDIVKNSIGNNVKKNQFLVDFFTKGINIVSNDIGKDDFHVYDRKDALKRGYKSSGLFPIRENGKVIGLLCLSSEKPGFFSDEEIRLLDEVTMDISFALDYYVKEAQRKEINDELMKSEKKFRDLFNSAGDAILLLDDYTFIEFNEVAEKVFGLDRNNLLFKSPIELSPELQSDGIPSSEKAMKYMNSAYEGNLVKFDWIHKKPNGELFETEVTLNSLYIGSKQMLLAFVHDISERMKYEEALKIAKEKAEEMNKVKSNFLANMSHELRTPMTGILGFAEILSDTLEDSEQREMAEVILKGGKRLTNTLNMILDLSKIEAEKISVNLNPTNLNDVIESSVKLFEVTAKNKNIELHSELKENIYALADDGLLEQVLSNLIKNALTYTEKGFVKVTLSKTNVDNEEYAAIKVIDSGIGIPQESLNLIFEPFRQVSEGWTRNFEGTGLGLTISQRYVQLMNGKISVESKLNEGTTFIVLLKTVKSENVISEDSTEEKIISDIHLKGKKKTLLVEDDELTIFTISKVLQDICEIDVTNNGFESIKMANEKTYEIILMDIGLKGMDGLEATKQIRKIPGYEKTPIVAITAYAMEGDREKFCQGGCSHYISKPFTNENLRKLVAGL